MAAISDAGTAERYLRGATPHTIFTWWARRPFAAMRGVTAAAIAPSRSLTAAQRGLLERYCTAVPDAQTQEAVRNLVAAGETRVLDLFSGGGTIPLVAAELGAQSVAIENNQLAYFTSHALLELSHVDADLAELVRTFGTMVLRQLADETTLFFPARTDEHSPVAYFWSRSVTCSRCSATLSLQKRPWLAKKPGKNIYLRRAPDPAWRAFTIELADCGKPSESGHCWEGTGLTCPFCRGVIPRRATRSLLVDQGFDELTAVCHLSKRGKQYHVAASHHAPTDEQLRKEIQADLDRLGTDLPEHALPTWSGVTNPTLYGLDRVTDLFGTRQLAVLVRLCRIIRELYPELVLSQGEHIARAVIAYLSALIDQLADWNNRLCMWIAQNEQVGRSLSGPGLPMLWDFVEVDPLQHGPANLWDKLDRIASGIAALPATAGKAEVILGDARKVPLADGTIDVVVTDPPYFDNVFYHLLADIIYVFKRLALRDIWPTVFDSVGTDQIREISASKHRTGSSQAAAAYYADGLATALAEARRVLKPTGVVTVVFSHSTVDGWLCLVEAMKRAGLQLVAAWPMQVERKHRPRGMRSHTTEQSFALVARPHLTQGSTVALSDLLLEVRAEFAHQLHATNKSHVAAADLGAQLLGLGAMCCTAYNVVLDDDGQPMPLGRVLDELVREIRNRVDGWEPIRR